MGSNLVCNQLSKKLAWWYSQGGEEVAVRALCLPRADDLAFDDGC